jgi:hypothetical protein
MFFPIENTQALSDMDVRSYQAYPMPHLKPNQCSSHAEVENEVYLSQKQAAAAALGLYFGLKHATAPHLDKQKMVPSICL